jgi:hypothetical protein
MALEGLRQFSDMLSHDRPLHKPIHTDSQVPLGYTYIGKAGKPVDV